MSRAATQVAYQAPSNPQIFREADGERLYSIFMTQEEAEGITRCELSEQLIERVSEMVRFASDSDAKLRKRGVIA